MKPRDLMTKISLRLIKKWIHSASKNLSPKKKLEFLFALEKDLYIREGIASIEYDNGIHTKHRHMNYHDFFISNILPGESILDIGSGNGFLSFDIAKNIKGVEVLGVEASKINYDRAVAKYHLPNLEFHYGDATEIILQKHYDVVVMSNVLEHIEDRIAFLKEIVLKVKPQRFLIRVPMFDRDWRVPLKKELGLDYRLDRTHFIEYTKQDFFEELKKAHLEVKSFDIKWGEIWSIVKMTDVKEEAYATS